MRYPGSAHLDFWTDRLTVPGYAYVIQGEPGTPIKVGYALDVRARMATLPPPPAYVNFASAQGGPLELSVRLGYRLGEAVPLETPPLVIAWEFVPVLIKLLQDQLDGYERQIGQVRRNFGDEAK